MSSTCPRSEVSRLPARRTAPTVRPKRYRRCDRRKVSSTGKGQGQDLSRLARRAHDVADSHERDRQQPDPGRERGIAPPESPAGLVTHRHQQAHERERERDLHPVAEHGRSDQGIEGATDDAAGADVGEIRGEMARRGPPPGQLRVTGHRGDEKRREIGAEDERERLGGLDHPEQHEDDRGDRKESCPSRRRPRPRRERDHEAEQVEGEGKDPEKGQARGVGGEERRHAQHQAGGRGRERDPRPPLAGLARPARRRPTGPSRAIDAGARQARTAHVRARTT